MSYKIPCSEQLSAVEKLCSIESPYENFGTSRELFLQAMQQNILWHSERNDFYRNFLKLNNYQLNKPLEIKNIPSVIATFFKRNETCSIDKEDVTVHLTSSGTTGQKSQMFFDAWTLGTAQDMVAKIFKHYDWISQEPVNYLLYTYETEKDSKLGTSFTDHFLASFAPAKEVEIALKLGKNGKHRFDLHAAIKALEKFGQEKLPVRIFGFPAFFQATLEEMSARGIKLELNPKSLVFLGGGWKGLADRQVDKKETYKLATEVLGIPDERLRDGFGSVEHCVPYVECEKHEFHLPIWSHIEILDMRTREPLPMGEKGFLTLMSPYITSVPANAVMMTDKASLHPAHECSCATNTPFFKLYGRAGVSKAKSCAVAAAELLGGV